MRKVFLEQNLGKKSKCRFPRKNQKLVNIKLTVESQKAVSNPTLTQPLVISGVSVLEFCDRFNQETFNLEPGLPIRSKVIVNLASKTFELELKGSSVYQLMKRVLKSPSLISKKTTIFLQLMHNIALIKLITQSGNNYFFSDLTGFMKQIAGNFRSYEVTILRNKKKIRTSNSKNGNLSTIN